MGDASIPSLYDSWYNCTEGCQSYQVYYNDYTGSYYWAYEGEGGYDSKSVRGDKLARPDKTTGIIVSLVITVLMCMPICSFVFLTRKRVYKKSALTEEGSELNFEATAVPRYDGVAAGQPMEEQK